MTDPVKLLINLGENNALKITLQSGIPSSLEELKNVIKQQCVLTTDFRLQYLDKEFGAFLNLTSTGDLKNMDKLKVIYLNAEEPTLASPQRTASSNWSPNSSRSSVTTSFDTDILSSPDSGSSPSTSSSMLRLDSWPAVFPIPTFSFEVNMQLAKADQDFNKNGILLTPTPKLKSGITEGLVGEIIKYKAYPSDSECDDVCRALITKHPCLKERGSSSGFDAWKSSLKYKMSNYRTKHRGLGCTELTINSMKRRSDDKVSPNQVKKARRAEVNFCPNYPAGEGEESQEEMRVTLLTEVQKKNNEEVIKHKMDQTFPHRRIEVIQDMPFIAEFKARWPALFCHREVCFE